MLVYYYNNDSNRGEGNCCGNRYILNGGEWFYLCLLDYFV